MAGSPEATRRDILGFLVRAKLRGDVSPTVREIGESVGLKSSRSVHRHLERLRDDGLVTSAEGRPRTLTVTDRGLQAVGEMPLMGRIAAGRGLEAIPTDEAYSLYSTLLFSDSGRGRYVLRVVGDSMYGAHIADGDVLIVEENGDPPDGAVVVALLHGGDEVTVKKLYRERGEAGDTVRLAPKNGDHEDIVVSADDVTIQGEVVYVIHPPRR